MYQTIKKTLVPWLTVNGAPVYRVCAITSVEDGDWWFDEWLEW